MKYLVQLDDGQREALGKLIRAGKAPARRLAHARILLKADKRGEALRDKTVAAMLEVSVSTVLRVRRRFAEDGLEAALDHLHPQRLKLPRLDPDAEAHLIALACGTAPVGRSKWSLRLLADQMVELGYVDRVSHETVRQALKKTSSSHTSSSSGSSRRSTTAPL